MSQSAHGYGAAMSGVPNTSRSYTTLGPATTSDNTSNGNPLTSTYTANKGVWGSGSSIWAGAGLSTGFPSRDATGKNSRSRDTRQSSVDEEVGEGKTGSGWLVESSVSDDSGYKTPWGAKRSLPSARSISHTQYSEASKFQPRTASTAGLPTSFANTPQNSKPFASRPPTISLNRTSSAAPNSGFGLAFGPPSQGSEQPPNVYTKFDRPTDPSARKQPDSAKSGVWAEYSPTDERKPSYTPLSSRTVSTPGSREGSKASSRFGDGQPSFTNPDYSRTSQWPTQSSSRAPSISSPSNGAYNNFTNPNFNPQQLALHLNQLNINNGINNRPATSHKSSVGSGTAFNQPFAVSSASPFSRSAAVGSGLVDNTEDFDRAGMTYIDMDGYVPPQYAAAYAEYAQNGFGGRDFETTTINQLGQRQPYVNGGNPAHLLDTTTGARPNTGWTSMSDAGFTSTRRLPSLVEQSPYIDFRMPPQMLPPQLRNPYQSMYNPYALQQVLQLNDTAGYAPLLPMNVCPTEANGDARDLTPHAGESVQSRLLYDYKTAPNKRRYELKDIYDHIAEFSGDQHGSRFIQTKLETANSDEKERVFKEIEPNARPLMTDVFGNYVIQKFFEHGDQRHKRILANKMKGEVLTLSTQMYGCRVVQKALDHVLVDQQRELISELEGQVLRCVKDQNGNHVIQKAIERCPPATIHFIIRAFQGDVQHLSIHTYGCRVIQRCLERCEPGAKAMIMDELMTCMETLISDQFGNYVVQHVVLHDEGPAMKLVLEIVGRNLEAYSKHKFASNVVEKCLEKADDQWRRGVWLTLATANPQRAEGEGVYVSMIKDNFGNYVIQKLLDTLCQDDYCRFIEVLQPALSQAKRTGCGKQVLSIEKRMHRFPHFRGGPPNGGTMNVEMYRLPVPASFPASTATTPPPLIRDEPPSIQSSNLPSIDGDAVEGASYCSRKGSQQSHNGVFR